MERCHQCTWFHEIQTLGARCALRFRTLHQFWKQLCNVNNNMPCSTCLLLITCNYYCTQRNPSYRQVPQKQSTHSTSWVSMLVLNRLLSHFSQEPYLKFHTLHPQLCLLSYVLFCILLCTNNYNVRSAHSRVTTNITTGIEFITNVTYEWKPALKALGDISRWPQRSKCTCVSNAGITNGYRPSALPNLTYPNQI